MAMEDVHLPIAQTGFQQQSQQVVTGKRRTTLGNQVNHDHFQHRLGFAVTFRFSLRLSFRFLFHHFRFHRSRLHRRLGRFTGRLRLSLRFAVLRGRGLIRRRRLRLPVAIKQTLLLGGGGRIHLFVRLHHGGRCIL